MSSQHTIRAQRAIYKFTSRWVQNTDSKSLEFQCYLEQDKQQLRPSHIISVNYLDLDQACAPHEFQVQSKFLCQNNLIQNSGEFMAENQVLERNYNRATIHYERSSSKFFLFIQLLKIEIKANFIHTIFIWFSFLDHTLLIYKRQRQIFILFFSYAFFNKYKTNSKNKEK